MSPSARVRSMTIDCPSASTARRSRSRSPRSDWMVRPLDHIDDAAAHEWPLCAIGTRYLEPGDLRNHDGDSEQSERDAREDHKLHHRKTRE